METAELFCFLELVASNVLIYMSWLIVYCNNILLLLLVFV
jgi:hypothetical protein